MPLFYLFWRSITGLETESSGGIWALILGSIIAFVRFLLGESLLGSFIKPGVFGLSRWLNICVDIVTLPAVLPLLVCLLLSRLRILLAPNYAHFALLWLIPVSAIRGVSWSAKNDPTLLVLTPILWTAIVVGLCFFNRGRKSFLRIMTMAFLPFLATTAYWAFFSQRTILGFLLLALTLIPMAVSMTVSYHRSCINL
ncbi:hypothetical protein AGMMS4952_17530 [Spirochaetia bacterium]|nr:hypothetical protein AGMMS4952_17530 [Spirochaetia bacterium]